MQKIPFLFFITLFTFIACNPNSNVEENKPIAEAIDAYALFLIQFEIEIKNSVSKNADVDEWESASQSLFINTQNYNNEISRIWRVNKIEEHSEYLKKWAKAELLSLKLEIIILENWKKAEDKSLRESLTELEDANQSKENLDAEVKLLKNRIKAQIMESQQVFEGAIEDVKIRELDLKKNFKILIPSHVR